MIYQYAITRRPGRDFAKGITHANLGPPSYKLALKQHAEYVAALKEMDLSVLEMKPLEGFPDACFVEDTAVVTPELAIITNPGAESRRGEIASTEVVLAGFHETARIDAPGTLDGGDVLTTDAHFLIGISGRTNAEGARQLGRFLQKSGYSWTTIPVKAGLHLKSSANFIGRNTLIVNRLFADHPELKPYNKIIVDDEDAYACNMLCINHRLLIPAGFPSARNKLKGLGLEILEVDMSEFRKMDGGPTCLSIRF
jgi:dimethylargininase